ncbi:hypothetical protein KKF91_15155 [Myxococcota bacterium]|nr:hypothetical protein [Myxococcota bacterium]MBU1431878.1 hypothetical protein [Myxococcota bacterium]MBU1899500.1 hypothetical protein [Myxococcota bacterium]
MNKLPLLLLLGLFTLGCGGAAKKYAHFSAECNSTNNPDVCAKRGYYAYKLNKRDEAKETWQAYCQKGSKQACEWLLKYFNETTVKANSDKLNTTEVLTADEAEKYISRNVHWKIDSEPRGAIINYRINSSSEEIASTGSIYLERTPHEAVKRLDIKGLTQQNMKFVSIVLEVSKKGYYPQKKEFSVASVIQQGEISTYFELEPKDK